MLFLFKIVPYTPFKSNLAFKGLNHYKIKKKVYIWLCSDIISFIFHVPFFICYKHFYLKKKQCFLQKSTIFCEMWFKKSMLFCIIFI